MTRDPESLWRCLDRIADDGTATLYEDTKGRFLLVEADVPARVFLRFGDTLHVWDTGQPGPIPEGYPAGELEFYIQQASVTLAVAGVEVAGRLAWERTAAGDFMPFAVASWNGTDHHFDIGVLDAGPGNHRYRPIHSHVSGADFTLEVEAHRNSFGALENPDGPVGPCTL